MHDTALTIGTQFLKTYLGEGSVKVLDVGAMDLNGSLRSSASPRVAFTGVDLEPGPGVDVVLQDPYRFPFESEYFDAVVTTSCFEHDMMFWLTFLEMVRVVKSNGHVYINAPSAGSYHRHPMDCWRFYPDAGLALQAWARRHGYFIELVESFTARRQRAHWSDCVMIFCKGSHRGCTGSFLADHFPDSLNIRRPAVSERLINYSSETEDMIQLRLEKGKSSIAASPTPTASEVYRAEAGPQAWQAIGAVIVPLSQNHKSGGHVPLEITEINQYGAHWIHRQVAATDTTSKILAGSIVLRDLLAKGVRLRFVDAKSRQVNWWFDMASMSVRSDPGVSASILSNGTLFARFCFDTSSMQPPLSIGIQMLTSDFEGAYEGDGSSGFVLDYFGLLEGGEATMLSPGRRIRPVSATPLKLATYAELGAEVVHESPTQGSHILELPRIIGSLTGSTDRRLHVTTPNDYVVRLHDIVCCPGQLLIKDGHVLPDTFRKYDPHLEHVLLTRTPNDAFFAKIPLEVSHRVEEPCFYLDGEHSGHFGHFTLELLSRLWPLLALDLGSVKFATSTSLLDHLRVALSAFGIPEDRIVRLQGPTRFRELFVSSQACVVDRWTTPNAFKIWDKIGAYFAQPDTPRLIYASRLDTAQRGLRNEEEIARVFQELGFTILHPRRLSFERQIACFRGASVVAGPAGSNLHNWVYSRGQAARLVLASDRFLSRCFTEYALITQAASDVVFISGEAEDNRPGLFADWRIDAAVVKHLAEELVARKASQDAAEAA